MSYQLIRESWPIARKGHLCIWCGESIQIGEKHRHEISTYDGFQDHRWHTECDADAGAYFAAKDGYGLNAERCRELAIRLGTQT